LAAGLPSEGVNAGRPRAADVARRDVPTCGLGAVTGEVRRRLVAAGWNVCIVVSDDRVVLGLLHVEELEDGGNMPVEDVMQPGPSTFRPHVPIEEMADYMTHHDLASSPVTTSDGRLVGMLMAEDAARAAYERHAHDATGEGTS
jgi:Mg/Co/Ni transporter MgtE